MMEFKMDPVKKYRLILIAICANMAPFSVGVYIGWTSPVVPKLRDQSADSPFDFGISKEQEGWIGSLTALGAFASSLMAGKTAAVFGRKPSLLLGAVLFAASYVVLLIGRDIWSMFTARVMQGAGGGFSMAITAMYVGEIATDDIRGALGSLALLFLSGGLVFSYSIGPFVSYTTLQWCCFAVPVVFFITFIFMPESPYFYALKNRKEDGIKSLQFLRGQNAKSAEVVMTDIQKHVNESMQHKGTLIDIFKNKSYRKALLIGCGLLVLQQFSGNKVVLINSQSIFDSANTSLDPAIATIILGLAQLVSNLFTPFAVERAGRKIILLISAVGMFVTLMTLGAFFYIQTFGDVSKILWLPVPVLITYNIFYGFGFGPIPWAVLGEMFPPNIKPTASSFACSATWLSTFLVSRYFPELNALAPYYCFWFFGIMCGLAFFFVFFIMIETKGLSLKSIQEKLQS